MTGVADATVTGCTGCGAVPLIVLFPSTEPTQSLELNINWFEFTATELSSLVLVPDAGQAASSGGTGLSTVSVGIDGQYVVIGEPTSTNSKVRADQHYSYPTSRVVDDAVVAGLSGGTAVADVIVIQMASDTTDYKVIKITFDGSGRERVF